MRSLGSGAGSGLNQRPVAYRIEGCYLGARHGPDAPWPGTRQPQCAAGKFVSKFLLISIAFSPVKPPPAASSEIALK